MKIKELLKYSAADQARAIKKGEVSSLELVSQSLDRIEQFNPTLNAFITVLPKYALTKAAEADGILVRARQSGKISELPFYFGLPIGVKDLEPMTGTFTRLGSRQFSHYFTLFDSYVTRKLKRAGFVIVGKLSTSEFGALPITEPQIHAPTCNPWNQSYSSGGSSGGTGSAVASCLIPIGQGSDGGGSIRIPSSINHLYGIKVSRGFFPDIYGQFDTIGLAVPGGLSHTVEDAARFLDVLSPVNESRSMSEYLSENQLAGIKKLKITVVSNHPLVETKSQVANAINLVARFFEGQGHVLYPGPLPNIQAEEFLPLWERMMANIPILFESKLEPVTRWLRANGKKLDKKIVAKQAISMEQRILAWFGDFDLCLAPTVACSPPLIGAWSGLPADKAFAEATKIGLYTAAANVAGLPAANIPMGLDENGLPFGVQIIGRRGADGLVLSISHILEKQFPWRERSLSLLKKY